MEEKTPEISKYNEAGLQILRLDEMWKKCERHVENGQLDKWNWKLDSIWRELYPDVFRAFSNKVAQSIIKKNMLLRRLGFFEDNKNKRYDFLSQRHEYLKWLQDNVGKGGTYSDGTEVGFE